LIVSKFSYNGVNSQDELMAILCYNIDIFKSVDVMQN